MFKVIHSALASCAPLGFLARALVLVVLTFTAHNGGNADEARDLVYIDPTVTQVLIGVDVARLLKLEEPAETFIIGNTNVADAVIVDSRLIVLTGRESGHTNILVLGFENQLIFNATLRVGAAGLRNVVVGRGTTRQSYICGESPGCVPGRLPQEGEDRSRSMSSDESGAMDSDANNAAPPGSREGPSE